MTRPWFCMLLTLALTQFATKCYADALLGPVDPSAVSFAVSVDAAKETSVLRISTHELARAMHNGRKQTSHSPASTRSIVAALTASIGIASVFLLRANRSTKIAVVLVAVMFAGSTAAEAWWNAAPQPSPPPAPKAPEAAAALQAAVIDNVKFPIQGSLVIEVVNGPTQLIIGAKPKPQPKYGPVGPGPQQ